MSDGEAFLLAKALMLIGPPLCIAALVVAALALLGWLISPKRRRHREGEE